MLRIAVPDLVSNSYFPIIAAVEMGFFKEEGFDALSQAGASRSSFAHLLDKKTTGAAPRRSGRSARGGLPATRCRAVVAGTAAAGEPHAASATDRAADVPGCDESDAQSDQSAEQPAAEQAAERVGEQAGDQ